MMPTRARLAVASRILAGTLGAYALTAVTTVILSLVMVALGMNRVEAVTAATLASFAIFAGVAIAVFHARNISRAWGWLLGVTALLALLPWLLQSGGAA